MSGLKYVGADYSEDGNPNDLVAKLDVDTEFNNSPVTQPSVSSQLSTAAAGYASQQSVNTTLGTFVQSGYLTGGVNYSLAIQGNNVSGSYVLSVGGQTTPTIPWNATATQIKQAFQAFTNLTSVTVTGITGGPYTIGLAFSGTPGPLTATGNLTNGTVSLNESPTAGAALIPTSWSGPSVAPLDSSGLIPAHLVPSFGLGYCLGPFGATQTFTAGPTGSTPVKIADWNIGATGVSFMPLVFMNLLAVGQNGGRPVIEVRMSSSPTNTVQTYSNQNVLVARSIGRSSWNDTSGQAIAVGPVPNPTTPQNGPSSVFGPNFNTWLSAWLYDANNQSVSVNSSGILIASVFCMRFQP